jgi:hypothetical protein
VRGADSGPKSRERAADLKQARVVQGCAHLGTGVQDAPHLVAEDCRRSLGVLDREGASEAAALGALGKVDELEPANRSKQPLRRIAYA